MRVSSLRYPKTQIAAGLFAWLCLGYFCSRSSLSSDLSSSRAYATGDLPAFHLNRFFSATRCAWDVKRRITN